MASKFVVALPAETMSATSLGTGEQRPMDDLRIDAYGVIDEVNSAIGLARVATVTDPDCAKLDAMLLCVQNDLFDLGADLYMPELNAKPDPEALRVIQSQVDRLERKINELNADLAPLDSLRSPGRIAGGGGLASRPGRDPPGRAGPRCLGQRAWRDGRRAGAQICQSPV